MIIKLIKLLFLLSLLSHTIYAQYSEYEIKAAYLKSISLFVEWPEESFIDSAFVITVVGKNPFNNYLEELARDTKINQKPIKINYANDINIPASQIVFISNSEKNMLENILNRINQQQTLIVGDTIGYAERGVHINFYNDNSNVLFEINLNALNKTNLKCSSRLIKLSKVID